MKERTVFCLLQILILTFANPANHLRKRQADVDLDLVEKIPFTLSKGLNKFNHDLFPKLTAVNDGNIVISPFSLHTALSMTLIGSPADSNTHKQLARALFDEEIIDEEAAQLRLLNFFKVLYFYENAENDVQIKIGNQAFAFEALGIKAAYNDILTQVFKSGLQRVNFADSIGTSDIINNYVSNVTEGLIQEVVQPSNFNSDTRLVLINAIYFKANWLTQFKGINTEPMKFRVTNDLEVDYEHGMNLKSELYYVNMENYGFPAQILELPYENRNFRMLLILPNEDINISELDLQNLDYEVLNKRLRRRKILLRLPRFKMEFEAKMRPFLEDLGVADIFDNSKANLKDIADDPLYVSDVTHKAVIEVNEEGSEAAAVSSVQINTRTSVVTKTISMIFDRPFYFIIQDETHNLNLFMGRIVDPSGEHGLGNLEEEEEEYEEEDFEEEYYEEEAAVIPKEVQEPLVLRQDKAPLCNQEGYQITEGASVALPCDGETTLPLRGQEGLDSEKIEKKSKAKIQEQVEEQIEDEEEEEREFQ